MKNIKVIENIKVQHKTFILRIISFGVYAAKIVINKSRNNA